MAEKKKRRFLVLGLVLGLGVFVLISAIQPGLQRDGLLECYGRMKSSKTGLVVELTSENPGITITRRISGLDLGFFRFGTTATISPDEWNNQPGFFALVDSEGRCWAYDGAGETWIYERLADGSGGQSWEIGTWQGEIPEEFAAKVPASILAQAKPATKADVSPGEAGREG